MNALALYGLALALCLGDLMRLRGAVGRRPAIERKAR